MPSRNINLPDRLDRFVQEQIDSGRYGDASEVIGESLRLLEHRRAEEAAKLKWLQDAVQAAVDQIDRGEGIEFDSIEELEQHLDRLTDEVLSETPSQRKRA